MVNRTQGEKPDLSAGEAVRSQADTHDSEPFAEAHFATMPTRLVERCVKAGSAEGGHVLDPFGGAGTTGLVAQRLGRSATLIELNPTYAAMARKRIDDDAPLFMGVR